jgi:hypothetical protein
MKQLTQTELEFVKSILLSKLSSHEKSLQYDEIYVENRRDSAKRTELIEDVIPSKQKTIAELNSILSKF